MSDLTKLNKADTVALWYAVDNYALMVAQMKNGDFPKEVLDAERARVLAAKRALRKVNAIRAAAIRGTEAK